MPPLIYKTLKVLFKSPIVILMLGDWRTGKTDTSLLLGHLGKKWGLIDKVGSNIWTFNNPETTYITHLGKLKRWLHADKATKLFIFDEALAHIPRRTAMSHKNVSMLKLLAELSKGHGRMIMCAQIGKLDSDILNPAFCRATLYKRSKKIMLARSRHFAGTRKFENLPRSPIRFDPDRLAPFVDTKMSSEWASGEKTRIYEVAELYSKGYSFRGIQKELDMHPEETRRTIRKVLKWFLSHYEDYSEATS